MELETVIISGLEYKVVLKGNKKFAYYKPANDWLGSTMPVWEIEQAIEDAKKPKPVEAPKHRTIYKGEKTAKALVLEFLADGETRTAQTVISETGINKASFYQVVNNNPTLIIPAGAGANDQGIKVKQWRLAA